MQGQAGPLAGCPPRSRSAAQMDDCSRQNPAYRPATEKPRLGGASLCAEAELRGELVELTLRLAGAGGLDVERAAVNAGLVGALDQLAIPFRAGQRDGDRAAPRLV